MYIVLLYAGKRLVRTEEFSNYDDMAKFVLKINQLYSYYVIPV
jgi:hypothetical protein